MEAVQLRASLEVPVVQSPPETQLMSTARFKQADGLNSFQWLPLWQRTRSFEFKRSSSRLQSHTWPARVPSECYLQKQGYRRRPGRCGFV